MFIKLLIIGLGGFIGAILRYSLSQLLKPFTILSVNVNILIINILGCFILGYLHTYFSNKGDYFQLFVATGILGAFTTFSTFSYEAFELIFNKKYLASLIYMLSSVILGIIGFALGNKLFPIFTK